MLYLLFGSDKYRRAAFVREIIDQRRDQYPEIIVRSFDCAEEGGLLAAYVFTAATNLFEGGKKICVCSHAASVLDDPLLGRLIQAAQRTDHIVFLVEEFVGALPPAFQKRLAGSAYQQKEFGILSAAQVRAHIQDHARSHGYTITPGAVHFLADVFADDLWGLHNELDMLGALKNDIDEDMARAYHEGGSPDVFAYAYGMLRAATRAQRLLQWELALLHHSEPMFLFNIMAKSASDKRHVVLLSEYDRQIKSGLIGPDQALLSFCCAL
jgi:DNA polymerase III delta subunit